MKGIQLIAWILTVVGGLNWLLVGLFEWDLVGGLLGGMDAIAAKVVYILVGLSAIYSLSLLSLLKQKA